MRDRFLDILKTYWGYTGFRGIQRQIIESVAAGRDTLGLMPTGGGKSITFQVPALAQKGLCLVVTPLVALMKDQVNMLRLKGIKATAVYNGMSFDEITTALDNCVLGDYKFLYVSPERLGSDFFITKVRRMNVTLITVDEAHCISQWGYDFRPSYLKISDIRKYFPSVPVLALTATATADVIDDIQRRLEFRAPNVFRMSFERKNLVYVVRHTDDKAGEMLHILRSLKGSAIVYTRSRRETSEYAACLKDNGIKALNYHAGLTRYDKDLRQRSWSEGETRVMVATNAFGMGIDKPDVRLVVHMEAPSSPEAYFQEAGRAGRDGKRAYAVLLYSGNDKSLLRRRVGQTFPPIATVRKVYDCLAYFFELAVGDGYYVSYNFNLPLFCKTYGFFSETVESALHILMRAGYIIYNEEEDIKSRVVFRVMRDELYDMSFGGKVYEDVVQALLRNYGGIFTDYAFIDEHVVADAAGIPYERACEALKVLSYDRVIHYIPHKRTPRITYVQRRVESSELVIGPDVYDDRRAEYIKRIDAMIHYAEDDVCHSRFLLNYFGESDAADCGKCDVCLKRKRRDAAISPMSAARQAVRALLLDGKAHTPDEMRFSGISGDAVADALDALLSEGYAVMENGCYKATSKTLKGRTRRKSGL